MVSPWYVHKIKMEYEDGNYPSIDTGTRRDVWISEHPLNIPRINFNYKILDSNEVET
jgi:hypothetical protein